MYDDTNVALIPADAEAVAGYVNGKYTTFPELVKRFPHAKHLSIAVSSHADADCLDVERGDATNDVAAGWVHRQIARGVKRPVIYTSVSNAAALLRALAAGGIERSSIRLWTAHYSFQEHLCGPGCGFGAVHADATQWSDKSHGRSLDQTICSASFFGAVPVPPKPPKPKPPVVVPPSSGVSDAEWQFREWAFGEGDFAAYGPFEGPRPNVPNPAPVDWHVRAIKFLLAREK